MREASYVIKNDEGQVVCQLCPHQCRIPEGGRGLCHVRTRKGEKVYSQNYGVVTSMALDPIEKKPLYHFYPGAKILSVGTTGCNFACNFCQNWQIAQEEAEGTSITPERLHELVLRYKTEGNIGIAYTYSEPAVWLEFILDVAPLVKNSGMKNVMVTNGFLSAEPWEALIPVLDAVNLDIKGFTSSFYQRLCRGRLNPVLESAQRLVGRVHLELTNLLIPGENDSDEEIKSLVEWITQELGSDVPVHFSRYYPQYKMDLPPTDPARLERAYSIAREKLNYVYLGNLVGTNYSNTYCPKCNNPWVERTGFRTHVVGVEKGDCSECGMESPLIGV